MKAWKIGLGFIILTLVAIVLIGGASASAPSYIDNKIAGDDSGGHDNIYTHEYNWKVGWNLFSVPLNNSDFLGPEYFENVTGVYSCENINNSFDPQPIGNYTVGVGWSGTQFAFNNYDAYWSYCSQNVSFNITGERIWGLDLEFTQGWNTFGWNILTNGSALNDIAPYVSAGAYDDVAIWNATAQTYNHTILMSDPDLILTPGIGVWAWSDYNVSINITDANQSVDDKGWANQKLTFAYENATDQDFILIWDGNYIDTVNCNKTNVTIGGWKKETNISGNITVSNKTTLRELVFNDITINGLDDISIINSDFINGTFVKNDTNMRVRFEGCTLTNFSIDELPSNTITTFTNCRFEDSYLNLSQAEMNNVQIQNSLIKVNQTLYLNDTTIIDNIGYRMYYSQFEAYNCIVRAQNLTITGGFNFLYAENSTVRVENVTFNNMLFGAFDLMNTSATVQNISFRGLDHAIFFTARDSNISMTNITTEEGAVGLRNSDVRIEDSSFLDMDFGISSTNITFINTSLEKNVFRIDGLIKTSWIKVYNERLERQNILIYGNGIAQQYWGLHVNSEPNTNIWVVNDHYITDSSGYAFAWALQWSLNETTLNDTTAVNVTVEDVNEVLAYVTKETWVNVTPLPDTVSFTLRRGWTLIGLSVAVNIKASRLLKLLGDGHKIAYRGGEGVYHYMAYDDEQLRGADFTLDYHKGYYIYAPRVQTFSLDIELEPRTKIEYEHGWNLLALPYEVEITASEFFQNNPEISMLYIKNQTGYQLFQREFISDTTLPKHKGIYAYAEADGEWDWQSES